MTDKRKALTSGDRRRAIKYRNIIKQIRRKNKFRLALLRGTFVGALMTALIGCLYAEGDPLVGGVIAGIALAYAFTFYFLNPTDSIFGG